jgi:hypothetical protein
MIEPVHGCVGGLRRGAEVAILFINFECDDYDAWKPGFDEDPAGRAEAGATSY